MKLSLPLLHLAFVIAVSHSRLWAQPAVQQMYAHCINVGQGDATLIEFPCGAVLIDAGAQDDDAADHLVRYLKAFFQRRTDLIQTLEAVYITHPHKDHTFALKRVFQNFTVKRLVENGQDYGSGIASVRWARRHALTNHVAIRTVINSEVMKGGNREGLTDEVIDPLFCTKCDPKIAVLSGQWDQNPGWPKKEFENNNNHSLVIRVEFGESSLMFTGDLEEDAIKSFLGYYEQGSSQTDVLDVDVYHVGHHGSHNATTEDWLAAMTPSIAVISVGQWDNGRGTKNPFTTWAYGHPRRTTIEMLGRKLTGKRSSSIQVNLGTASRRFFPVVVRKKIYATAWDGDTTIRASLNHEFEVSRNN